MDPSQQAPRTAEQVEHLLKRFVPEDILIAMKEDFVPTEFRNGSLGFTSKADPASVVMDFRVSNREIRAHFDGARRHAIQSIERDGLEPVDVVAWAKHKLDWCNAEKYVPIDEY